MILYDFREAVASAESLRKLGGLPPGLELVLQSWASRTGALGMGRSGAAGTGRRRGRRRRGPESVQFRDRDPQGSEAKDGGGAVIHEGRI